MHQIDPEIIAQAASGDVDAFERIYREYSPVVYSIALRVTRDIQDAQEATQDAFVRIYGSLKDFRGDSSFGTWIYRISLNVALNVYRARSRQRRFSENIDRAADVADSSAADARQLFELEQKKERFAQALGTLGQDHRDCIILREIEGLDYEQMAQALRIPVNTVRSRLARARQALADIYLKGRR